MRNIIVALAAAALLAAGASALEAAITSYEEGALDFSLAGSGTVSVNAQIDFKYISDKTGSESLARATSDPVKVNLTAEGTPVTIEVVPPDGTVTEVEVVLFVNGEEKARQTFYY
jgi:hypothetical protein